MTIFSSRDREFLLIAIELAIDNILNNGGPFGAVVALDGKIISACGNRVIEENDPTAHAEIVAIREASGAVGRESLQRAVLYSSCEPCPMCLGAIYWAGIERVVYAATRDDAADAGFDDRYIFQELCRQPHERDVVFQGEMRSDGQRAFKEWMKYPLREEY